MQHLFERGRDPLVPTLVLFHGTGGTERDLLPIAQHLSPSSSVLSLRGEVSENGMARFFRRLSEGVFDEEDLIFRTREVNDFLTEAASTYGLDRGNFLAVGYSNGANIAGSLLFHHPGAFRGAILHHPMVPRRGIPLPDLTGVPVFIGAGRNDPICSPQETEELDRMLREAGAAVTIHWETNGHRLTPSEVDASADWLRTVILEK